MVEDYNVVPYDDSSKEAYDEAFKIDDDEIKSVIDKEEDPSPYNASSLILLYVIITKTIYIILLLFNSIVCIILKFNKEIDRVTFPILKYF